jgi:hypothetical protein
MRLFTVLPKFGAYPEVQSFLCEPCNEAVTVELTDE